MGSEFRIQSLSLGALSSGLSEVLSKNQRAPRVGKK